MGRRSNHSDRSATHRWETIVIVRIMRRHWLEEARRAEQRGKVADISRPRLKSVPVR